MQRLTDGPPIKPEDGTALQQFSIQLASCANTLKEIGYINKLDNPENLRRIIDRLPYGMRLKWRDTVDRIVESEARDVTVEDIMAFVTAKARAATHPIFGKVQNENKAKLMVNKPKQQGPRASGFSTQGKSEPSKPLDAKCLLCSGKHWLPRCARFRKQSLAERQRLVKEKRLCHNCLSAVHFVRACPKQSYCKAQGCTTKHLTFLHSTPKPASVHVSNNSSAVPSIETSSELPAQTTGDSASSGYIKSGYTTSASVTGLAIVPVLIKVEGKSDVVETYAFLNSGSNTSFCTEALLKKLGTVGKRINLSLTTLQSKDTSIESSLVSLEVLDLDKKNVVKLPAVYSRRSLPIPPGLYFKTRRC